MKKISIKNKRYTTRLALNDGTKILIPKPYIWGTFEKAHGCSLRKVYALPYSF